MSYSSPNSPEGYVDTIARTEALKIELPNGEIKLSAHNQIDIEPKGSLIGTRLRLERDGSIAPAIIFDTDNIAPSIEATPPKEAVDEALDDFLNNAEAF